jgi:hypothetical protein
MVAGIARLGGVTPTLTAGNLTAGHRDRFLLSGLDLVIEPSATVGYLFVDWTLHLTSNHKERLLVDGCGLDRLAGIITAPPKQDRGQTYKTHE